MFWKGVYFISFPLSYIILFIYYYVLVEIIICPSRIEPARAGIICNSTKPSIGKRRSNLGIRGRHVF